MVAIVQSGREVDDDNNDNCVRSYNTVGSFLGDISGEKDIWLWVVIKMPEKDIVSKFFEYLLAENEAFKKAGLEVGTVVFTCPLCGGKAIGNRYKHDGRIHGLGSGCIKCGIRHT